MITEQIPGHILPCMTDGAGWTWVGFLLCLTPKKLDIIDLYNEEKISSILPVF